MFSHLTQSIRGRLYLSTVLTLLGFILIGTVGLTGNFRTSNDLETMNLNLVIPLQQLKNLTYIYGTKAQNTIIQLNGGEITSAEGIATLKSVLEESRANWGAYRASLISSQEKEIARSLDTLVWRADSEIEDIIRLLSYFYEQGDRLLANRLDMIVGSLQPKVRPILSHLERLGDIQNQKALAYSRAAKQRSNQNMWIIIAATIIFILLAFLINQFTESSLNQQIAQILPALEQIGKGDLTVRLKAPKHHELNQVTHYLNHMTESLEVLVSHIHQGEKHLNKAVGDIRQLIQKTSKHTHQSLKDTKQVNLITQEAARTLEWILRSLKDAPHNELNRVIHNELLRLRNRHLVQMNQLCGEIRKSSVLGAREVLHVEQKANDLHRLAREQDTIIQGFARNSTENPAQPPTIPTPTPPKVSILWNPNQPVKPKQSLLHSSERKH